MGIFNFWKKDPKKVRYKKDNGFLIPVNHESKWQKHWEAYLIKNYGFRVQQKSPLILVLKKGTYVKLHKIIGGGTKALSDDVFFEAYVDTNYEHYSEEQKKRFIKDGKISLCYFFATDSYQDRDFIDLLAGELIRVHPIFK